jgi:hypothetical protein
MSIADPLEILKIIVKRRISIDKVFQGWLHEILRDTAGNQNTVETWSSTTLLGTEFLARTNARRIGVMDVDMGSNSPPRKSGNKRAAVGSPSITPPSRPECIDHTEVADTIPEDLDMSLEPAKLEEKFDIAMIEATGGREGAADTPNLTEVEGQDGEAGLNTGVYLPYEFDDEDS